MVYKWENQWKELTGLNNPPGDEECVGSFC